MSSSEHRGEFWRSSRADFSEDSIVIIPDGRDPFEGLPSKEEILAKAFKVDVNPLYEAMLQRYPEAAAALAATGADPRIFEPQENMYLAVLSDDTRYALVARYRELEPNEKKQTLLDPERFDNAVLHNVMVGVCVAAVAEIVYKDDPLRQRECVILGMVHDANKTSESQRNNLNTALMLIGKSANPADIELVNTVWRELDELSPGLAEAVRNPISAQAYEQFKYFLARRGASPEVIDLVLRAGEIAGHGSFSLLTRSRRPDGTGFELCTDMLPALLVNAVDNHISSPFDRSPSMILTARERMIASDAPTRYPRLKTEGIAARSEPSGRYRVVDVKNVTNLTNGELDAVSYMEFQPLLADAINTLLARRLGILDANPRTFLRDLLVKTMGGN